MKGDKGHDVCTTNGCRGGACGRGSAMPLFVMAAALAVVAFSGGSRNWLWLAAMCAVTAIFWQAAAWWANRGGEA